MLQSGVTSYITQVLVKKLIGVFPWAVLLVNEVPTTPNVFNQWVCLYKKFTGFLVMPYSQLPPQVDTGCLWAKNGQAVTGHRGGPQKKIVDHLNLAPAEQFDPASFSTLELKKVLTEITFPFVTSASTKAAKLKELSTVSNLCPFILTTATSVCSQTSR